MLFICKNYFLSEDQHNLITKRLTNYLDNEGDILNSKHNDYDTFNNNLNNSRDLNSLIANQKTKSFDGIIQAEQNEKTKRLVRFAGDYCRASPNIVFKDKYSLLNIGWRNTKSSFVVDYDFQSKFSGEKKNVLF